MDNITPMSMSLSNRTASGNYRQAWSEYNMAQTHEKLIFRRLLYELCQIIEEPIQAKGRPRLPFADMIFCVVLKVYSTVSARRFISDLRKAQFNHYIQHTSYFNSISNYLEQESLTPVIKQLIVESSLVLKGIESDFAVDSSGFSTGKSMRCSNKRYGHVWNCKDWPKVHLMCGVSTNIVTSVEVSDRYAGDSPYFKPLVKKTAHSGFQMHEVSADKAYLSGNNLDTVTLHGATPYIPFKSNSTTSAKSTLWNRLFHLYMFHQDEFMKHYHKRSNVESTFSMLKAKFGEHLRSKTLTAQINESLCKVLCHNICVLIQSMYELGIDINFYATGDSAQKAH